MSLIKNKIMRWHYEMSRRSRLAVGAIGAGVVGAIAFVAYVPEARAGEVQEVARIALLPEWAGAEVEARLWDRTRVDLLTDDYAIEADWSYKWAEAIGQSLYYAEVSDRKPGIMLLVKDMDREAKYIYRCQTVAAKYGIKIWIYRIK